METIVGALRETVCRFYLFNFSWSLDFFFQKACVFSLKKSWQSTALKNILQYWSYFTCMARSRQAFVQPAERHKERTHTCVSCQSK